MVLQMKSTDKDINIFLSPENPRTFLQGKTGPENAFLTPILNYRKIIQKSKLYQPKQQ